MKRGLDVWECVSCGLSVFPRRLGCPRCGAAEWRPTLAEAGILEQATLLRRAPGREVPAPVPIGSVRLDAGPLVTARLTAAAPAGTRVQVLEDDGVPVADVGPASTEDH